MTVRLRKWLFLSDYADILNRDYLYGEVSALETLYIRTYGFILYIYTYICVIHSTSNLVMEYYYMHIYSLFNTYICTARICITKVVI